MTTETNPPYVENLEVDFNAVAHSKLGWTVGVDKKQSYAPITILVGSAWDSDRKISDPKVGQSMLVYGPEGGKSLYKVRFMGLTEDSPTRAKITITR